MKKILLTICLCILNVTNALSQSVYMHEAQQDAEESGDFSISGLVLLIIVIGIIWFINACITDAKEKKEQESQRILKERANRQVAKNKAISIIHNDKSISIYVDNEKWQEGFIEATYDILFGKPKHIAEDMETLNQRINHIRAFWNRSYDAHQRFNDTIKMIGYLSRLEYNTLIEKQKEENGKKLVDTEREVRVRESEEKNEKRKDKEKEQQIEKDIEVQGCILQNRGKILTKVVASGDIHIPEGVEIIKGYAFKESPSITSIKLPDTLKIIEKFAFAYCKLPSLEIPKGVEKIEKEAFSYSHFEEVIFHNCIEHLPNGIFSTCRELKHVKLPSNLKAIPSSAFENCWVLEEIAIPETVTVIGDNAFSGCQSLMEIQLPKNLEELGRQCFSRCYSLKHIEIPPRIVGLPKMCLYDCIGLEKVLLHDGLYCIMSETFGNSSKLKVQIPHTICIIQADAFTQCNDLHLIVPNGRKEEFESKCKDCRNLEITEYSIDSDIHSDVDKEKRIDKFMRLQKIKEEHDLFIFSQEMAQEGIFIKTGNPAIDLLYDDSFLLDR